MYRRNASSDENDPTVKLFGMNITLPDSQTPLAFEDSEAPLMAPPISDSMRDCLPQDTSPGATKIPEEPYNIEDSDNEDENPTPKCLETTSAEQQNTDDTDKNREASKPMAFRKPDKILPCPRCKSMETKFCYFNNYNVNQPRQFCRSCSRYWTAGGTIRNIPIGAGRRKNKHSSSHLQPVVIPSSEGSFTRVNLINPDNPLCKSVASRLTLEEPGHILEASSTCFSTRDNDVSHALVKEKMGSSNGFPGQDPPLYPWSFGWNVVAYGGASCNTFLAPWNSPTMEMNPGLFMPNATFPFVPSMCLENSSSNSSLSPASCSGNTSPLGKHSRETNSQDAQKNEKSLWIPKTLRIDDPEEAAKSSIWSTLGIEPGKTELAYKGGMFKAFQPRDEKNPERPEADEALKANPAALLRLEAFQEST